MFPGKKCFGYHKGRLDTILVKHTSSQIRSTSYVQYIIREFGGVRELVRIVRCICRSWKGLWLVLGGNYSYSEVV